MRTDRLQALADVVFSIALTLLVLERPLVRSSSNHGHDLLAHWPAYAAYAVSFVTVAIVWVNHQALMDRVRTADRTLLELSLLLLLLVAVVPWSTGLVASFFATLQTEPLDRRVWATRGDLASAVFAFIEGFYNPRRRHSTLG